MMLIEKKQDADAIKAEADTIKAEAEQVKQKAEQEIQQAAQEKQEANDIKAEAETIKADAAREKQEAETIKADATREKQEAQSELDKAKQILRELEEKEDRIQANIATIEGLLGELNFDNFNKIEADNIGPNINSNLALINDYEKIIQNIIRQNPNLENFSIWAKITDIKNKLTEKKIEIEGWKEYQKYQESSL